MPLTLSRIALPDVAVNKFTSSARIFQGIEKLALLKVFQEEISLKFLKKKRE